MSKSKKTTGPALDWSRILGFDQVDGRKSTRDANSIKYMRLAKVGTKIGGKGGFKPGGPIPG